MGSRRRARPSHQRARDGYHDSPAPREIQGERARNDGQALRLDNLSETLAAHNTRLGAHSDRLDDLEAGHASQANRLDVLANRIDALVNRVDSLENFRDRPVGFAQAQHNHDDFYFRRDYVNDNFATRPHGAGQHV